MKVISSQQPRLLNHIYPGKLQPNTCFAFVFTFHINRCSIYVPYIFVDSIVTLALIKLYWLYIHTYVCVCGCIVYVCICRHRGSVALSYANTFVCVCATPTGCFAFSIPLAVTHTHKHFHALRKFFNSTHLHTRTRNTHRDSKHTHTHTLTHTHRPQQTGDDDSIKLSAKINGWAIENTLSYAWGAYTHRPKGVVSFMWKGGQMIELLAHLNKQL